MQKKPWWLALFAALMIGMPAMVGCGDDEVAEVGDTEIEEDGDIDVE